MKLTHSPILLQTLLLLGLAVALIGSLLLKTTLEQKLLNPNHVQTNETQTHP